MKTIQYFTRRNYGCPTMYVADWNQRDEIRRLTRHESLTLDDKEALEGFGYTFVEVLESSVQRFRHN